MPKGLSISNYILQGASQLRDIGIDTPEFDSKLLMQHASGFSNVELISQSNDILEPDVAAIFLGFIKRRLEFEPVHRILGYREFYGRNFLLSDATLIPRPDTEILVETVISQKPLSVLEIGTGSGAIAVSLAAELNFVSVLATDISSEALATASKNASAHGVEDRIKFMQADLYHGVEGRYDMIVSNPPYIPSNDIFALQKEVQIHDPRLALDGGEDGLDFYRRIFQHAAAYLNCKGKICVEIGIGQDSDVALIAQHSGFKDVVVIKDLNQINRVVLAKL